MTELRNKNETKQEQPTSGIREKKDQTIEERADRQPRFGWGLTLGLIVLLVCMIVCLWALFISGPSRLHEARQKEQIAQIKKTVPDIEGLQENKFDYVTWQGYTDSTLYWFDQSGAIITERPLSSLDYDEARKIAKTKYDFDADTVTLAYGYSAPVYQLESSGSILMLDYDTLEWVYERNLNHDRSQ